MNWCDLLFMHYRVNATHLASLLPAGVTLDTFDGQAWIGIVPFRMTDVAPRGVPAIPWLSKFPELNVRTYVVVDGKPGVWFFTLDATNPVAVRAARWLFHLNYVDAKIDFKHGVDHSSGEWMTYHCRRHGSQAPPAELNCRYRPVGEPWTANQGTLDHWLTSRYCLYAANRQGQIFRGNINHEPWRLQQAEATTETNTMLHGLDIDTGEQTPILHFAKSISVVAWMIERCG